MDYDTDKIDDAVLALLMLTWHNTHLGRDDRRTFTHDAVFPVTLVFNRSNHRYSEPWYYGVSRGPTAPP